MLERFFDLSVISGATVPFAAARPRLPARTAPAIAVLLLLAGPGSGQDSTGLRDLPLPRAGRALQFSSHDPAGGNEDSGHFLAALPDGRSVLARCGGPGRITRIWSANPGGTLRIELDGEVVYEGGFGALFDGSTPPWLPPLADRAGGGFVSHVPMPFRKSCLVTTTANAGLYYHVGVQLGAEPERFTRPPGPLLQEDIARLLAGARSRDEGEVVRFAPAQHASSPGTLDVARLKGPGEVIEVRLRPQPGADCLFEVIADGAEPAALSGPVGHVFGVAPFQSPALRAGTLQTQAVAGAVGWWSFRLPMPFRESLLIRLRRPAELIAAHAPGPASQPAPYEVETVWRRLPPDQERLWLHGRFQRQANTHGKPFPVVHVAGRGHFVGAFFTFAGAPGTGLGCLEGDERIAVDGAEPAFLGTGTEDYLGGAWYFRTGPFDRPFHAVSFLEQEPGRVAAARWHVPDPIPFTQSFAFDLEHGGANDAYGSQYTAMAFWYGDSPRGEPLPELTFPELEPRVPAFGRGPELHEAGGLQRVDPPVASGADMPASRADAPGSVCRLEPGGYRYGAHVAGAGVPWLVTLLHRGVPVQLPSVSAFEPDSFRVRVNQTSEVDQVLLEPWLDAIRAWRVAGPFRVPERGGIDVAFGPERDAGAQSTYAIEGGRRVAWRTLAGPGQWTGYVDLLALFEPADAVVAYAFTVVRSPSEQTATLFLGSDDAVKVLLAGAQIHRHAGLRGSMRDQDAVPIRLRAGDNPLLLKVENYRGGFGFHVRIAGAEGLTYDPR